MNALAPQLRQGAFGWLVDQFVAATPGVRHALAVRDEAVVAASAGLEPVGVSRLAGVLRHAAGLTDSAAGWVSGQPVVSCLLTERSGLLLVLPIPGGGALAVVADGARDAGQVGYEATLIAGRLGDAIAAGIHAT